LAAGTRLTRSYFREALVASAPAFCLRKLSGRRSVSPHFVGVGETLGLEAGFADCLPAVRKALSYWPRIGDFRTDLARRERPKALKF
jgi:hypothetical protein